MIINRPSCFVRISWLLTVFVRLLRGSQFRKRLPPGIAGTRTIIYNYYISTVINVDRRRKNYTHVPINLHTGGMYNMSDRGLFLG